MDSQYPLEEIKKMNDVLWKRLTSINGVLMAVLLEKISVQHDHMGRFKVPGSVVHAGHEGANKTGHAQTLEGRVVPDHAR